MDMMMTKIDKQRCKAWQEAVDKCKTKGKISGVSGGDQPQSNEIASRGKDILEHIQTCNSYRHQPTINTVSENVLKKLLDQEKDRVTRILIHHYFRWSDIHKKTLTERTQEVCTRFEYIKSKDVLTMYSSSLKFIALQIGLDENVLAASCVRSTLSV